MTDSNAPKIIRLLGLARRAGYLALGTQAVELAVRRGQTELVLLAADAGPHTEEKIVRVATQARCPLDRSLDRQTMADAVGKNGVVTLAITDPQMAKGLKGLISGGSPEPEA